MNIVLIGMPGCGKSTVGVVLAKRLGFRFIDADLVIQEQNGCLLQQIINERGTDGFLQAEESALISIDADNTVIATGGSAVYSEKGMAHLMKNSIVLYIRLSLAEIEKRLDDTATRGIAGAESYSLAQLYSQRTPLYEKYADLKIDADGYTIEQTISTAFDKVNAKLGK